VAESKEYIRKLKEELIALREQGTSSGMLSSVHYKNIRNTSFSRYGNYFVFSSFILDLKTF
jgi:hypothetical protein